MGSIVELNDTLRISKKQGFPRFLKVSSHLKIPHKLKDLREKVFEFKGKPKIRVYQQPPVRCFLVEDLGGKWIYWGLCHIIEIKHDYVNKVTSGKFKIVYLNTPEEMKKAHDLIDRNEKTNYFTK